MKYYLKTIAAVAVAVAAAAPAFAGSQLAASAGISPAEAQGLSLTEVAQTKFNRDADEGDGFSVMVTAGSWGSRAQLAASAGLSPEDAAGMTLSEIAAVKFNRDADTDERQQIISGGGVTAMSRSVDVTAGRAQLIASAGLTVQEAAGMSLTEIAAVKFSRDADHDGRVVAF